MSELIDRQALESWLRTECYGTDTYDDKEYVIGRLREELPTVAAPRWVSIDDELPKEREWVLVWHTGYATAKKALFKDRDLGGSLKFDGGGGTWVFDGWSDRGGRVTHWMPLPEPPEGAEVPTL